MNKGEIREGLDLYKYIGYHGWCGSSMIKGTFKKIGKSYIITYFVGNGNKPITGEFDNFNFPYNHFIIAFKDKLNFYCGPFKNPIFSIFSELFEEH